MAATEILLLLSAQDRTASVFNSLYRNLQGLSRGFSDFNTAQRSMATLTAEAAAAQTSFAAAQAATAQAAATAAAAQTTLMNAQRATVTQMARATGASLAYRDAQLAMAAASRENAAAQNALRTAQNTPSVGARVAGGVAGAAAVGGAFLAYRSVKDALAYQQQIADIVSTSTQNQASIPTLQRGILQMVQPGERFNASEIAQGLYPILSNPMFSNPQDALGALRTIVQQAQGSGASSINALAQADVGATSAFGFKASQLPFVANVVQTGVNVGSAEPVDFARGVATFAASARAAGASLQDAVGAFAQSTNLSPRFRFQAQDLNRLFVDVNKTPTGKPALVASDLGIGGDFGPGGIARAGGFANWLRAIQQATQGPNQQALLQRLFPNIASLTAIRGLTGGNFASGQERIAQTQNAEGAVARVAAVADRPPMAQLESQGARFNKDLLLLGDTISKTVVPSLVNASKFLLGGMETIAGRMGTLGDWLGHHTPGALAGAGSGSGPQDALGRILDQHLPGGAQGTFFAGTPALFGWGRQLADSIGNKVNPGAPPKTPPTTTSPVLSQVPTLNARSATQRPVLTAQTDQQRQFAAQQALQQRLAAERTERATYGPAGAPTYAQLHERPSYLSLAEQEYGAIQRARNAQTSPILSRAGIPPPPTVPTPPDMGHVLYMTNKAITEQATRTANQAKALADANSTAATRGAVNRGAFPVLGRPTTPGDPTARYGQVVTRMSTGSDTRDTIARLERQIALLQTAVHQRDQQINADNEQIRKLSSVDGHLARIDQNTSRQGAPTPIPPSRTVPRRVMGATR